MIVWVPLSITKITSNRREVITKRQPSLNMLLCTSFMRGKFSLFAYGKNHSANQDCMDNIMSQYIELYQRNLYLPIIHFLSRGTLHSDSLSFECRTMLHAFYSLYNLGRSSHSHRLTQSSHSRFNATFSIKINYRK